jgi:hypothetical protein
MLWIKRGDCMKTPINIREMLLVEGQGSVVTLLLKQFKNGL